MRPKPKYSGAEGAILSAMYDAPNGTYTSYTLSWQLNPDVKRGSEEDGKAIAKTREALESLIEQGLVQGERLKAADGVYFTELKLTAKGERAAIGHRREEEQLRKEMPKIAEESNKVIAEINKANEKKE